MKKMSKWCLIGIPDHQGVLNVGGRIGAAFGPDALRTHLFKMSGPDFLVQNMDDLGDVESLTLDVSNNLNQAAQKIATEWPGSPLVVIGGGHDHGYSHLLGIKQKLSIKKPKVKMGCINIDAHLDLRKPEPKISSGSPFYLTIENKVLSPQNLVEFGIQTQCNGPTLWEYAKTKGIKSVLWNELRDFTVREKCLRFKKELKRLVKTCDNVVVSLDLDAAHFAAAPGVSAPQSEGFCAEELIGMISLAAKEEKVQSLGIFELNPLLDPDQRTAKLAATLAFRFAEGKLLQA